MTFKVNDFYKVIVTNILAATGLGKFNCFLFYYEQMPLTLPPIPLPPE